MTTPHVVIVGGGISGLAAAHALATGVTPPRITVLEGSPRLGGKLAGDVLEGIPVDLGAESVLARRPEAVDLIKAVGLTDDVVHPATTKAGLWIADGIHAIPPTVMGVPTDARAVADVLGPSAAARVAAEVDLPAPALTEDVSIGRYVAERMGQSVTDKLVDPLLGGVYAGRADEISLAAAVPELFARLAEAPSLLAATAAMQGALKAWPSFRRDPWRRPSAHHGTRGRPHRPRRDDLDQADRATYLAHCQRIRPRNGPSRCARTGRG